MQKEVLKEPTYVEELLTLFRSNLGKEELLEKISDYHESDIADAMAAVFFDVSVVFAAVPAAAAFVSFDVSFFTAVFAFEAVLLVLLGAAAFPGALFSASGFFSSAIIHPPVSPGSSSGLHLIPQS